jgi:hypothetical protein
MLPDLPPPPPISWHRLFGLLLADYLDGTPFEVELEKDLSLKKQLLDVVIIRKRPGVMIRPMPDGLQDLQDHNLITFKSFRQTLDDWSLKELTGHYVNYRKQEADADGTMPSESKFALFGVCARYPRELLKTLPHTEVAEGVYDCQRGSDRIRVIVANQLSETEHNSLLHLFSAVRERVEYGSRHHRTKDDTSSIVSRVFDLYQDEGNPMPYTIEDYKREMEPYYMQRALRTMPREELLEEVSKLYSSEEWERIVKQMGKPTAKRAKVRKKRKKS